MILTEAVLTMVIWIIGLLVLVSYLRYLEESFYIMPRVKDLRQLHHPGRWKTTVTYLLPL